VEKISPDFQSERIRDAGDTITVLDNNLGYSFDAQAIEYERYPFELKRGRAVLANFRPMKTSDYIFHATVSSNKAIVYTFNNAVLTGIKYDDSLTLVDGLGMKMSDDLARERLRIGQTGPDEYGLAKFNKAGDKAIWQEATTGEEAEGRPRSTTIIQIILIKAHSGGLFLFDYYNVIFKLYMLY